MTYLSYSELVKSLVLRTMRSVRGFSRAQGPESVPSSLRGLSQSEVIGWYINPPPNDEVMLFTSDSILVCDAASHCVRYTVRYDSVISYVQPGKDGSDDTVVVSTRDDLVRIRVAGRGSGNARDVFTFAMLLRGLLNLASSGSGSDSKAK